MFEIHDGHCGIRLYELNPIFRFSISRTGSVYFPPVSRPGKADLTIIPLLCGG